MTEGFRVYASEESKTNVFMAYLTDDAIDGYFVDTDDTYVIYLDILEVKTFDNLTAEQLAFAVRLPNTLFVMDIREEREATIDE